jgi:hypothetical protein
VGEKPKSERVKATFYFDPGTLAALEAERLRRIEAGTPRSEASLSDVLNDVVNLELHPRKAAIRRLLKRGGRR